MASYEKKRHVEASDESTLQAQDQVVHNDLEGEESSEDDSDLEEEAMDTEINEVHMSAESWPFSKKQCSLGGIADLLLSQNQIGCVVKQSEAQLAEESDSDDDMDDHVYGVTSVISLADKEDIPCIAQIRDLLITKCKECADSSCHAEFQRLLDKTRVGLLISERFLNIPPQLAPPLHLSLHKDLTRAKSKDEKWNFEYLVLMCKCYETMGQAKKKKKKKDSKLDQEIKSFFFANAEDEIFQKESILSFKYSILEETDTAIGGSWGVDETQLKTYRTVMVVPMLKMADILRDIQNNLSS
ncbi:putative BRCA2 and CDKN1A-interacting protein [Apostichopus japonicus]|uniref:Putative BRCA2 and CDKN1A-interacting protein n=1 Tax=Stichopus japonicus TaxID=307972 RepID=A0A2G8LE85_STIJA|nr:putative BRCA2 and CDKN1A-interacting protein [Apostichopus japonicus]